MFIPFDEMKDTARLWVYQCNRVLADDEVEWLSNSLSTFAENWKAHGQSLVSSFVIKENIFIVLAVDEESYSASGCSIDASVHEVQSLQQKLGVDFFIRDTVLFKKGSTLERVKLTELKQKALAGELQPDNAVFNTLVNTKGDLKTNWVVPAGNTWLKRYFKTVDTLR